MQNKQSGEAPAARTLREVRRFVQQGLCNTPEKHGVFLTKALVSVQLIHEFDGVFVTIEKINICESIRQLNRKNSIETVKDFVRKIPKVELHVHLEGTYLPERVLAIADRNSILLPDEYNSLDKIKNAYIFKDLFNFLELYSVCASTLQTEYDFEELTMDYLKSAYKQGIVHSEIFVGFQLHMDRGVEFGTVLSGIKSAIDKAESEFGITASIILDVDRGKTEISALHLLNHAFDSNNCLVNPIIGVGLAYAENELNPPSKFIELYRKVHQMKMFATAHAGEAFGPVYIQEAIEKLNVHRIDHGVRAIEDNKLVQFLVDKQIPLTVCPLSNICLKVYKDLAHHSIKSLMDRGVMITINSDDPAYFGGGIIENYDAIIETFNLSLENVYTLARNSIIASNLGGPRKNSLLEDLEMKYNLFSEIL